MKEKWEEKTFDNHQIYEIKMFGNVSDLERKCVRFAESILPGSTSYVGDLQTGEKGGCDIS